MPYWKGPASPWCHLVQWWSKVDTISVTWGSTFTCLCSFHTCEFCTIEYDTKESRSLSTVLASPKSPSVLFQLGPSISLQYKPFIIDLRVTFVIWHYKIKCNWITYGCPSWFSCWWSANKVHLIDWLTSGCLSHS